MGQEYAQTNECSYLGNTVTKNAQLVMVEIKRRIRLAINYLLQKLHQGALYDGPSASLKIKVRMLKAEVLEKCCLYAWRCFPTPTITTSCGPDTTASFYCALSAFAKTWTHTGCCRMRIPDHDKNPTTWRHLFEDGPSSSQLLSCAWMAGGFPSAWCQDSWRMSRRGGG